MSDKTRELANEWWRKLQLQSATAYPRDLADLMKAQECAVRLDEIKQCLHLADKMIGDFNPKADFMAVIEKRRRVLAQPAPEVKTSNVALAHSSYLTPLAREVLLPAPTPEKERGK